MIQTAKKGGLAAYQDCDGYGAPAATADGMTGFAYRILGGGGDATRTTPAIGLNGLGACGAALEDLEANFPQHWMRRVSLLRARAIHRLAVADTAGALRDVDAAKTVAERGGGEDVLARRSLGLGVDFVRATALRRSGQAEAARSLALDTWAMRPWSRESAKAALIALGGDAPDEQIERVLRAEAQLDPASTMRLFNEYFERGRFADALSVYDALTPPIRLNPGNMIDRDVILLEQSNRALTAEFWADADGRKAYALAALGRPEEAKAVLQAAETRFAGETPPTPPLPEDPSQRDRQRKTAWEQANLEIKTTVPGEITAWRAIVIARLDVADGKLDSLQAYLAGPKPRSLGAGAELLEAASAHDPRAKAAAETLRRRSAADRILQPDAEARALFETLPETETRRRLVGDHQRIVGDGTGFSVTAHPDTGLTTVDVRSARSSLAIMEEEALLKAAELASRAGKSGILVEARKDVHHSSTTYTYSPYAPAYGYSLTLNFGFQTWLDVVFVDLANPAPPYDKVKWRVIDAAAVRQAMNPVYRFNEKASDGK